MTQLGGLGSHDIAGLQIKLLTPNIEGLKENTGPSAHQNQGAFRYMVTRQQWDSVIASLVKNGCIVQCLIDNLIERQNHSRHG